MMRLVRRILGMPDAHFSDDEIVSRARAECARRGLSFLEPVAILHGLRVVTVHTNAGSRGGNVRVDIDVATGQIRHVGVNPR